MNKCFLSEKRHFGTPIRRWDDNIRSDLKQNVDVRFRNFVHKTFGKQRNTDVYRSF